MQVEERRCLSGNVVLPGASGNIIPATRHNPIVNP